MKLSHTNKKQVDLFYKNFTRLARKHKKYIKKSSNNTILKWFNNKGHKDNPRSHNSFYRELSILQTLEREFINEPKINHYPFPKILSYSEVPDSQNMMYFEMNYCGINALENAFNYTHQKNIQPTNLYDTVVCKINNLKNNLIQYEDFKANNVCINNHGYITLIDFGRFKILCPGHQPSKGVTKESINKFYKKKNNLKDKLYDNIGCLEHEHLIYKALEDFKWKRSIFKLNPWSMLYMF